MSDTVPCSRCQLAKATSEMTMSTSGAWLCRVCQAHATVNDAAQVANMKSRPMSPLLILGLLALGGLGLLFLLAYWYGEGMRHAL